MTGRVRRASAEDTDAIGQVHYDTHVETYAGNFPVGVIEGLPPDQRARMWRGMIDEGVGELWVADVDGSIVGFASTLPSRDENPRVIAFYRRNSFEPDGAEKLDERWGNIREIRLVR